MATFERTLKVDKSAMDFINKALNSPDFMGEDDTRAETAVFSDDIVMDIKCCGAKDEPAWTEAVLLKRGKGQSFSEVAVSDVSDEFLGEWELDYNGDTYRVNVVMEG